MKLEKMVAEFYEKGIVKQGSFTLKSGNESDIYLDLRALCSFPHLIYEVAAQTWNKVPLKIKNKIDCICGVPDGAVPLATIISQYANKPQITLRKEVKKHGTKQRVEGLVKPGARCFLIEDVVTTGSSLKQAAYALTNEGFVVKDLGCVVLRDEYDVDFETDPDFEGDTFRPLMHLDFIRSVDRENL